MHGATTETAARTAGEEMCWGKDRYDVGKPGRLSFGQTGQRMPVRSVAFTSFNLDVDIDGRALRSGLTILRALGALANDLTSDPSGRPTWVTWAHIGEEDRLPSTSLWRIKAGDVSALPRSLDGPRVVVFADVRNGFTSGHALEHRHAGECGASPSAAAITGNLDALCASAVPRFV